MSAATVTDAQSRMRRALLWHVHNVRASWAWRLLDHSEAVHRVAYRVSTDIPSPDRRDQALMIGLLAGTGDLGGALGLNPFVSDLQVIADQLRMPVDDLLMWMQLEAHERASVPAT